jgi:hypothetical protein
MTLKIGDVLIFDKENLFLFISIFLSDVKTEKGSTLWFTKEKSGRAYKKWQNKH